MAYTRLSMRKTREILRLHHSAALSNRAIARSLKLSASTRQRVPGSCAGSRGALATAGDDDGHRPGAGAVPAATGTLGAATPARVGHRAPGTQTQRRHADVAVGRVQSRTPQRGDVLCLL